MKFNMSILGCSLTISRFTLYFEKGHYGQDGPRLFQFSVKFIDHLAIWVTIWKWYGQIGLRIKGRK